MAKRFTDTSKWKRPWFRALSPQAKILWQYLCDECDHAGVFLADFELISFQIGFRVDESRLAEWLGEKLVKIAEDKYFIPSFFEFQYGDAKEGFKAKQSAIKVLKGLGLVDDCDSLIDLTNSYLTVQVQSTDCHIISTSKGKSNTGDARGAEISVAALESAYQLYPRKEGKSDGLKIARAQIKTSKDLADLNTAIERYKAKIKNEGTEAKFIQHFSTFMGRWRDWLDPSTGSVDLPKKPKFDWDAIDPKSVKTGDAS